MAAKPVMTVFSVLSFLSLLVYIPFVALLIKFRHHSSLGSSFFRLMISNAFGDMCMIVNMAVMGQILPRLTCEHLEANKWLWGNVPVSAHSAFQTVGTLHVLLLTWNRYDALASPLQFRKKWTVRFANVLSAAAWLIGAGSYVPFLLFVPYALTKKPTGACGLEVSPDYVFATRTLRVTRVLLQLVTALFLAVFYAKMYRQLRKTAVSARLDRATRRLTLIGALLAAPLFLLCIMNLAIIVNVIIAGSINPLWHYLKIPIFTALYVLLCENPFVVWAACQDFRVETKRLVGLAAKPATTGATTGAASRVRGTTFVHRLAADDLLKQKSSSTSSNQVSPVNGPFANMVTTAV